MAGDDHGTQVAGIIFAPHDGVALAGLSPAARLIPIRAFRSGFSTSASELAMSIDAAWQNSAHVISNSWNGPANNTITSAINRATSQGRGGLGSIVVFSAGNVSNRDSGQVRGVEYPATLSNVIAVGAINRWGNLTNYTPEGSALDIVAPSGHYHGACGGDVITADLLGWSGCNDGPSGDIDSSSTFSGTSAAAPQVAAVAAMVLSRNPSWTGAQVRAAILDGADPWGPATQFGRGKLNAYRALVGRLAAGVSGNSYPSSPGVYAYSASVSGGTTGNSYSWASSRNGGGFQYVGSGTGTSVYIGTNETVTLRVTVTGPDGQRAAGERTIYGPYQPPPPQPCSTSPANETATSGGETPSRPFPPPCLPES